MKNFQYGIFIILILISIKGKSQFFEYDNHLFTSSIGIQDTTKIAVVGLDMTTNSKYFVDKSVEIGGIFNIYSDSKQVNSLFLTSNLKSYFNNSFYVEYNSNEYEGTEDLARDGYYISVGLIYQFSKNNLKFSCGLAPRFSDYYQEHDAFAGYNSTLLFEYKRIMLLSNLVLNQFNQNFYNTDHSYYYDNIEPFSCVSISPYLSSTLYFKLNLNSNERVYLKYLNMLDSDVDKMAIGLSIPIYNRVIINPEIVYELSSNYPVSDQENRYSYGILAKVRIRKLFLKSFVTYHKEYYREDLNINFGMEYFL